MGFDSALEKQMRWKRLKARRNQNGLLCGAISFEGCAPGFARSAQEKQGGRIA